MSVSSAAHQTALFYSGVINDVVKQARDAFLDEGLDPGALLTLKQKWEAKIVESHALDVDLATKWPAQYVPAMPSAVYPGVFSPRPPLPPNIPTQQELMSYRNNAPFVVWQMPPNVSAPLPPPPSSHHHKGFRRPPQLDGDAAGPFEPRMDQMSSSEEEEDEEEEVDAVEEAEKNFARMERVRSLKKLAEESGDGKADPKKKKKPAEEDEVLNSNDDESDVEDPQKLFQADNVVLCQFEKVSHRRGKWMFQMKDGVMRANGKDFVFNKCTGEAIW